MKLLFHLGKRKIKIQSVSITKKRIKEVFDKELKDILKHFGKDTNYPLNKSYIVSSIILKLFNYDLLNEFDQLLINNDLSLVLHNNESYITTKKEYKPIYYNNKLNKIKLVEDSFDKSYISKFSERNGWEQIGTL